MWFLVKEKGLPSELETVIFDLWALRVAQLGDKIASESQENQSQSQVYNSLESEDDATDDERDTLSSSKSRNKKLASVPNLYDCLALCYLGTSTLRLPVTPGDIYAWTTDGKLAYGRAIRLVPLKMRDRLPPSYHAVLDPPTLLRHKRFYTTLTDLEISYSKDHGILWPPLNIPLLLFRYIKELALPLELYDATLRLGDLLGYDFGSHYDRRKIFGLRHLPGAQLIGCFVVCVKLFYPFDKVRRSPKTGPEPAVSVVDWKKWCKQVYAGKRKQQQGASDFTSEEFTKLEEKDILDMTPDQVDQYLDFYQFNFLDDVEVQRTRNNDDFRNALYNMFPVDGDHESLPVQSADHLFHEQSLETVHAVHGSLKMRTIVREDEDGSHAFRPGQSYPMWKKVEDLPDRAAIFYEEAARLAGFTVEMLVTAVFFTETGIEKWKKKKKGHKVRD